MPRGSRPQGVTAPRTTARGADSSFHVELATCTGENAGRVQAKLVAEGANGPTSLEGDAILAERGIVVLPDVLTNAGGVTVSYFEWVQDLGRLFWSRAEIRAK